MKLLIITQKVDKNDQLLGFFIEWIVHFAKKFEKVTILCLEKGEFSLPPNAAVISMGKEKKNFKVAQGWNFYRYIIKNCNQYDSVFVHMNPIWVVLGGVVWRMFSKKTYLWYTSKGVTPKLKLAEKLTDKIFTASTESFRLPSKKVIVTGHGVDTELFKPDINKKVERFSMLSIGRITEIKNYEILVGAAKILKDQNVEFSVTMIGEPALKKDRDYEQKLKILIGQLGLQEKFNFLGKVNHQNLVSFYQSHHLFIHLSKTGSLDKTILEAMACGMKVLSSNDSARSFLPENLIFDENNPSDLADKITKIKRYDPGDELRDYVIKNHNLDNLINKISKIINA